MRAYNATYHITENDLLNLIKQQLPNLNVETIGKIGEGWDNYVYEINSNLIFRIPRRKVAVQLLEIEKNVMPKIAKNLNYPVSSPIYAIQPSDLFPHLILGYKKIQGTSGDSFDYTLTHYKSLAVSLGKFLKCLHALDVNQLGLENSLPDSLRIEKDKMEEKLLNCWADLQKQGLYSEYQYMVDDILQMMRSISSPVSQHCIVHGDLYSRHLILDNQMNLSGIIDWGDISFSHPVVDLMVVYQFLPPQAHQNFFQEYGEVSAEILVYAKFLGLYSAILLLWYGNDIQNEKLISSAEKTLKFLE